MKQALLFGLNYTHNNNPDDDLRGCINDVINLKSILQSKNYHVETYTDYIHTKHVNIIRALYRACLRTRSIYTSDLFISFSGHGTRSINKHEIDGYDECICPSDHHITGVIKDDVLREIIQYIHPRTKLFLFMDCCHSEGLFDLQYKYTDGNWQELNKDPLYSRVILFSGCESDDYSADAYNVQGKYTYTGAFTSCFIQALQHSDRLIDIFKKTRQLLKSKQFQQIPQLTSSTRLTARTKLFV